MSLSFQAEIERIEKLKEEVARAQAKPQYPMSQATREMVKNRGKYLMGPDCENYGEMLYIEVCLPVTAGHGITR